MEVIRVGSLKAAAAAFASSLAANPRAHFFHQLFIFSAGILLFERKRQE
jgi:hypothetical protein